MRMLPSTSVRQIPSMVASINARWRATVVARARSLVRSWLPTTPEPKPSTQRMPTRTIVCAAVGCVESADAAAIQRAPAKPPVTMPAAAPLSTPMSITHGANTIAPVSTLESVATTTPNVTSIPTSEMAATTNLRRTSVCLMRVARAGTSHALRR